MQSSSETRKACRHSPSPSPSCPSSYCLTERSLYICLCLSFCGCCPRGHLPWSHGSDSQQGFHSGAPQTITNKEAVLNWLIVEGAEIPISPVFPLKGSICILQKLLPEGQASIQACIYGLTAILQGDKGSVGTSPLPSFSSSLQVTSISMEESYTHVCYLIFCSCCLREVPLDHWL